MDVNGVRFHLLQGERDWRTALRTGTVSGLEWDRDTATLSLRQLTIQFRASAGGEILTPDRRRGAACDRFGNWYWIDSPETGLVVTPCPNPKAQAFWTIADLEKACEPVCQGIFRSCPPPPPRLPDMRLRGLAVTAKHYLVVGTVNPGGLLIFDLHGGGDPVRQVWPEQLQFEPLDMAATPDGGVWILGRSGAEYRVWRLDSYLRVMGGEDREIAAAQLGQFFPETDPDADTSSEACFFAEGIPLSSSPGGIALPRAIETISPDAFLILDTPDGAPFSTIHLFEGAREVASVDLGPALLAPYLEPPALVRGHDLAFVAGEAPIPGTVAGRLYVAAENGDQAFAFTLESSQDGLRLEFVREYFPMRRFSGLGLVSCGGWPHYDLQGQRWMPLSAHRSRRYVTAGEIEGIVLDGKVPGCVWHRVIFDGMIPEGTKVEFFTRAADDRDALPQSAWRLEPLPYRRAEGPEVAYYTAFTDKEAAQSGTGTWELLLQSARGRYLELRIRLLGDGPRTPRLRSLRVYYQRFSYLERYMPAVYREEPVSASFLDRYLANVEGLFTSLEDRIAKVEGLFDERISPAAYIEWLAGWFDFVFDPDWEESRRRLFLRNASLLFQWRGTVIGLLAMIRLAVEPCPDDSIFDDLRAGRQSAAPRYGNAVRIVERFLSRTFGGVAIGDPTVPVQPGLSSGAQKWTPSQGADPLHAMFREFLRERYALTGSPDPDPTPLNAAWNTSFASLAEIRLSPVLPAQSTLAGDWQAFVAAELPFSYAIVTNGDTADYQQHLRHRYGTVASLNAAYQLFGANQYTSFDAIDLPAEADFPPSGPRLFDWIGFVSLALPIRDAAYRFSVLIPATPSELPEERQRRLTRVEAVVRREKPGHTEFEIKPFWALFQVGTARLGFDTTLGEGSRFTAIELGRTATGEGFLAHGHPWNVRDRWIVGRDSAGDSLDVNQCCHDAPLWRSNGSEMTL